MEFNSTEILEQSKLLLEYGKEEVLRIFLIEMKKDWQLQGSFILLCLFLFLLILLKIEWKYYGPVIMGMELSNTDSSYGKDSVDFSFENCPDEDPLTFLNKTKR